MFFKPISLWRVFSLHFNSTSSIPKIKGFYHISSLSRDCRLIFFAFDAFFLTGLFPSFSSKWTLIGLGNVTSYCTYRQVYYHSTKTLTVLNKVVCFNPWRFPSGMLDKACLSMCIVYGFHDFPLDSFFFRLFIRPAWETRSLRFLPLRLHLRRSLVWACPKWIHRSQQCQSPLFHKGVH